MNLLSPQEQEKLQRDSQTKMLKRSMKMQESRHKELKGLNTIPIFKRNMIRLQCRSHPLSLAIAIDGNLSDFVTPHTFDNLSEGKHIVEMHYFSEDGALIIKKEEVELKKNKRVICKLYFKTPRTLTEPIQ